jgi:hypothetical protein
MCYCTQPACAREAGKDIRGYEKTRCMIGPGSMLMKFVNSMQIPAEQEAG